MKPQNKDQLLAAHATQQIDYRRILEILRKRWGIMAVAFLGVLITASLHLINQKHYFISSAKIAFTSSGPQQVDLYRVSAGVRDFSFYSPLFLKNQIEILSSDRVLRKAVHKLQWVPDELPESDPKIDGQVRRLRGLVQAQQVENTSIIVVSSVSGSANNAYQVTKVVSEVFVNDNLERQVEGYQTNFQWLTDQLVDLERKLEQAQMTVTQFVRKEKLTKFGDADVVTTPSEMAQEEVATKLLGKLREQRFETELRLSRLEERYLEAHPKVVSATNELARANKRIATEESRLQTLKSRRENRIMSDKQKELQYKMLTSKVEKYKEIYDAMVRKLEEIDIGSAIIQNNASIIEEARMPFAPAGPHKRKRALYSVIAALIFAFGLAFIVEYLDNSLRTAEEVESYLSLPVLANVPLIQRVKVEKGAAVPPLLAMADEDEQLQEAFRVLRTNLRFSMPARGSHSLLVTSTRKGEGKSTIAANLAVSSAELGKKTILVDCDLRLPDVHDIFQRENERGLTHYLTESIAPDQLIQATDIPHLDILPAGPESPKPTALLESDNMMQLIPLLQDTYEMVILDAPPIGMVIDTAVIAGLAEGILMVIEAEKTNRHHVLRALDQLDKAKATVHGVVLNKLLLQKKKYLSYYGYYYQGYKGYSKRKGA